MKNIQDLAGHELKWSQPHALKMEYELHDGEELVATLRFRSSFGSFATAECAGGCWTFKRTGFWQTRVSVRACDTNTDLAFFKNNTWANGGTLELPDGRKYPANTNFWGTSYEFKTEAGEPLVSFRRIEGLLHLSSAVDIQPAALSLPELPWLVIFGWYLAIMLQMDSAAAAGSVAAVS